VRDLPGDLLLYFDYANHVKDGHVPYRDFPVEYPPLALVPILAPFAISHAAGGFFFGFETLFAIEMYLLALAGGFFVWRLMPRVLPGASSRERYARLVTYVAAFPLLGQIVTTRLDLFPTVLLVLALLLWVDGREGLAWPVLALGIATKLFPAIVGPLFVLDVWRRRGLAAAARDGAWCGACCALLFVPVLVVSPEGLRNVFTYHAERGTQIESLYANALLIWHRASGFEIVIASAFGAFEVVSAWTDELRQISMLVTLLGLGVTYLLFARLAWRSDEATSHAPSLVVAATLALAVFIVANKVLSPQYLIWLIPLVVLLPGLPGRAALALFLPALALTQYVFPNHYGALLANHDALVLAVLTARNVALLGLVGVVGYGLLTAGAPDA
jgi:hypothetical protein